MRDVLLHICVNRQLQGKLALHTGSTDFQFWEKFIEYYASHLNLVAFLVKSWNKYIFPLNLLEVVKRLY